MSRPVLVEDWVMLKGKKFQPDEEDPDTHEPVPVPPTPMTFYQSRHNWVWTGDAQGLALVMEIKQLSVSPGTAKPLLRLETAACEAGPWIPVFTAPGVGTAPIFLRRNPPLVSAGEGSPCQQMLGYLRWVVDDAPVADNDVWTVCFRIVGIMETV